MISLKDLEKAVKKVQEVTSLEKSILVNDVKITYRTLDQEEEVLATEYTNNILTKFEDLKWSLSSQAALGLAKRIAYLSYAIIEIDNFDLRNVDILEDFDEEGETIFREKREVIRDLIIKNWDSDFTMRLFQQWMAFSMESSIRLMEQVLIDYKSLEDQRDYHQKRYEDIQERINALRGETAKEKLGLSDEQVASLEKGSEGSNSEKSKVLLESPSQEGKDETSSELNPEKILNPKHPEEEKWEDIQSSFIGDDDPNQELLREIRRQEIIQKEAKKREVQRNVQKTQTEQQTEEAPRLNRGLPEMPARNPDPQQPPESQKRIPKPQVKSSLQPISRGQKGEVSSQVSNLRGAFQTGSKIVRREPEEYLEYTEEDMKKSEKSKPQVKNITGGLNPYYRDPEDL